MLAQRACLDGAGNQFAFNGDAGILRATGRGASRAWTARVHILAPEQDKAISVTP